MANVLWWYPQPQVQWVQVAPETIAFLAILMLINIVAILWALIDIARSKGDTGYKLIWAFICVIFGIIGAIIYYFAEKYGRPAPRPRGR